MRATFMRATVRMALLMVGSVAICVTGAMGGASAGLAAPGGNALYDKAGVESLARPVQYWRGERGEGNCRRYREECGGTSYCERLRRACVYKEYRGEAGEGNCRRYRNECGGY